MLNDLLTVLREGESVSPFYLARKALIPVETIVQILNAMVSRSMLTTSFIIRCDNEDPDIIHSFEFEEEDELLNFLRENEECPDCDSQLLKRDIRVFYKMKSGIVGDLYG